ncbi:YIEGIA family protein [Paenibacillus radicis (ex Xue et al. 2023)]|uniref:YIEGIA family protein n=1 Tax=Paenibacillus radicis (ex Xue et al. 2023) TaxID=2972489 RepID=A0ABT1YMN6_9BACL|nr:YIEGIA family protein [Paenibacillus radicis (ex Xue et al. 2023)]MCR8634444.1 YIEGIA family protein [Paenibacillus radicis (ex Xue et al. 2023)]
MLNWIVEQKYTVGIVLGVVFGLAARLSMLRTDYRQYPTYPHGRIIHISLGVIAAGLGSVAVPSLLDKNYTAVTFLSLAAQQFRDVRNMERQTLSKIDSMELVPRGATYIEGIAMVFEGRNYLVIFTSFIAALFSIVFSWYWGIAAGICAILITNHFKSGKSISHIADVHTAEVRLDGPNLFVDDIYIMNVGLEDTRSIIRKRGIGLILVPKNKNCRVTLANVGQRQAILHDLSTILGIYRDEGEPSLLPLAKLDMADGRLAVFLLPQERNVEKARRILMQSPVLESAVRMPTEANLHPEGKEGL